MLKHDFGDRLGEFYRFQCVISSLGVTPYHHHFHTGEPSRLAQNLSGHMYLPDIMNEPGGVYSATPFFRKARLLSYERDQFCDALLMTRCVEPSLPNAGCGVSNEIYRVRGIEEVHDTTKARLIFKQTVTLDAR